MLLFAVILITARFCSSEYPDSIPGPRHVNDAIAIVGAGPAGIHMAMKLKELGFNNITVYEEMSTVSGGAAPFVRLNTTFTDGISVPADDKITRDLVGSYLTHSDLVEEPEATVWSKIKGGNLTEMNFVSYVIEAAKSYVTGNTTDIESRNAIYNAIIKYVQVYNQFITTTEDVISEPSWEGKFNLYGTVKDFLNRNGIAVLTPIFNFHLTLKGLGSTDEVSSFYGLMVLPVKVMQAIDRTIKSGTRDAAAKSYIIKGGYIKLLQAIISKEGINVVLNTKVDRLRRTQQSPTTKVYLRMKPAGSATFWKTYDFVIWSGNMRSCLKTSSWKNQDLNVGPSQDEYQNFLRVNTRMRRSTIFVHSIMLKRGGSPIDTFVDEAANNNNGIYQMRDAYGILMQQTNQERYRNLNYSKNANGSEFRTMQIVHYSTGQSVSSGLLENRFVSKISSEFRTRNITFSNFNSFPRNPTFSSPDITNGMIWKVLKMQGKFGVWYIGKSVIHEPIKSNFAYNELLIRKLSTPDTKVN